MDPRDLTDDDLILVQEAREDLEPDEIARLVDRLLNLEVYDQIESQS